MTQRSVTHATFTLERNYDAAPAEVFHAFADLEAKRAWFHGPEEWGQDEHEMDFRVGGREINSGGPDGEMHVFDALYHEIVTDSRIVYSYDMYVNDVKLSVSLTTLEFAPSAGGTRFRMTEHGAYFDGHEDPKLREEGTAGLLDQLGDALATARSASRS